MVADNYDSLFPSIRSMSFSRFRELPAELRLNIWHDALPGPRTIHLVNDVTNVSSPETNTPDDEEAQVQGRGKLPLRQRRRMRNSSIVSHCTSTVKSPHALRALLHTCHESRIVVLCRYQPLFVPKTPDDPLFGLHFFDPLRDGIFVDEIWPWVRGGSSKPTGLFNARILSISCNVFHLKWVVNSSQLLGKGGLLRFRHLEELHIVHRILTEHEREKIMHYKFGQYMAPGDMTQFLRRAHEPHDIAFPSISVDIRVEPIFERFAAMRATDPSWNAPKVKLVAWATRPDITLTSPIRQKPSLFNT